MRIRRSTLILLALLLLPLPAAGQAREDDELDEPQLRTERRQRRARSEAREADQPRQKRKRRERKRRRKPRRQRYDDDRRYDDYYDDDDDRRDRRRRRRRRGRTPRPRRGFQIAVRTGFAMPIGELRAGIPIGHAASLRFPVIVDIGYKLSPHWFIGGYGRVSPGLAGERFVERCDAEGGFCLALDFAAGALGQYHFLPAGSVNPWVGLGVGVSALSVGAYTDFDIYNVFGVALDFARVSSGVDFRLKPMFGLGPYAELGTGMFLFTQERGRFAPLGTAAAGSSIYFDITVGIRFVFFP